MQKVIQRTLWSPQTYKNFKQYINYFDYNNPIFQKLNCSPPIVTIHKIEQTKKSIKQCEDGKSTLLHIGDCAQTFQHADPHILCQKIKFMKQCQRVLSARKSKPAHLIGRIAGQYAKPRSTQFITKNGVKIHNYKGDNVNNLCESDRDPCAKKLFKGYEYSIQSAKMIEQMFPELFISHEGLILPYEQSFTKQQDGKFYCQSAHMVWIGERTRQIDGAHLEYFRGIENPIGIKISSAISEQQFSKLVNTLNPKNQKGKLLVIIRMGQQKIKQKLGNLIKVKQSQGLNFLFVSDPMHGNTFQTKSKLKTRNIDHILQQIKYFQQSMDDKKLSYGYSLEATFENVTQCYGLAYPQKQDELNKQNYTSKCDPRLNGTQTLRFLELLSTH